MLLQRLQQSREIESLYRSAGRMTSAHLRLFWRSTRLGADRLAIVISTKVSKKSTRRNRFRRITREYIRANHVAQHSDRVGHDLLIVFRSAPNIEQEVLEECGSLLSRAFGRPASV
ncbi:ribonuclease P protein component [Candidatus Uhrbacteria bacterium]|nr:ribonuclease P protein component [Candidatus Uhrbacteria bacterium]